MDNVVEKIVLVTGDGDLVPAVKAIEPTRTIVRLAYVSSGPVQTALNLIKVCPETIELGKDDIKKLVLDEDLETP